MGYRSDVGFVIRNDPMPYASTTSCVSLLVPKFEEIVDYELFDFIHRPDDPKYEDDRTDYCYFVSGVKWYEDYPVVQEVNSFLNMLNPEDYRYVVVGEEADDNTIKGYYWDNEFDMDFTRGINLAY